MGLDNGIVVKNLNKNNVPNFVILPSDYQIDNEFDIVYWRKCWGIRNSILDILHGYDNDYTSIEAEDIPAIIRQLYKFCSKEYWDENAESIWEFEEAIDNMIIQAIINLKWLYSYMLEHSEVTCYFYDSY